MREDLKNILDRLKEEHRALDDAIMRVMTATLYDQVSVQRMKKKKLKIKDEMLKIETKLLPDIIA